MIPESTTEVEEFSFGPENEETPTKIFFMDSDRDQPDRDFCSAPMG